MAKDINNDFFIKGIARYYDVNTLYYRMFWHGKRSLGIHHGFYNAGVNSQEDAILEVNKELCKLAKIKKGDKVLDAGCGVGGSSLWLAKNIGANVIGITISPSQIKKANKYKKQAKIADNIQFLNKDFSDTKFHSNSFDVVWAIESICHAKDKNKVVKEIYRILKPGGRFVISDWFQLKPNLSQDEKILLNEFINGFAVESIETTDNFRNILQKAGFTKITEIDHYGDIKENLKYGISKAKKLALFARVLPKLFPYFKEVARNYYGALAEEKAYKKGLWTIRVFLVVK